MRCSLLQRSGGSEEVPRFRRQSKQQIDTLLQSHSVNGFIDRIRNWDRFQVPLLSVSLDTWNDGDARFDIARALVLAGADPNALDWVRRTPLELAVLNVNKNMTSFLLDHGARLNGLNGDGEAALCNALMNGLDTETRLLLERGANPDGRCTLPSGATKKRC